MPENRYPGPETIHRTVLDNGIVVLVYENFAAESVVLEGVVRAGALADSREKAGLAAFTAACLMRGTHHRSFETIYEEVESVGANLSLSSGRHTTGFAGSGLAEDLGLLLELLGDVLRYPTFPPEQVEKVRGEILTGLQMEANDTRRMASKAFRATLYQNHCYGAVVSGETETVAAITAEELAAFHAAYYGPKEMIVTVVGAVKAEAALEQVIRVLGDWHHPAQKALPAVPDAPRPPHLVRTSVHMPGKSQSDIVLGLPGPRRAAPDYQDIRVANTILGVFGMMGRLGKRVREQQGLAYYIYSRLQGGLGPAPWYVATGVAPDKVEQAIGSIRAEIRRLQDDPVPAEELADTQAFLTGRLPVSLETNDGLASVITDIELYQLGRDYLQRYPAQVEGVTVERVQAAARKYLSAEEITVAVAGPGLAEREGG